MKPLRWVVFASFVALAGCAGRMEPVERVVVVEKKVKERCIDKAPIRPIYRFGKGDWSDGKEAASLLADDFEKAEQYGHDWEAAAAGCLVVPAAKP